MTDQPTDAIELLQRRFAAGEITAEEFDSIRERLAGVPITPAPPLPQIGSQPFTGKGHPTNPSMVENSRASFLVTRFLRGHIGLLKSFWLVYLPATIILVGGPAVFSEGGGRLLYNIGIPVTLFFWFVIFAHCAVSVGAFLSSWKSHSPWSILATTIIPLVSALLLYAWVPGLLAMTWPRIFGYI